MNQIVGHQTAVSAFLEALHGGRLHHAWLLHGPEGVGKAMLAQALARYALCHAAGRPVPRAELSIPYDDPIGRLVEVGSHPDLFRLERLPKDAKAVRDLGRNEWPTDLERARSITIDQVRDLIGKFGLKPALSTRRIVIIDSVDDLERSGANGLLKGLEEPPSGTIFLLLSHSPGRLLPTIRSRCRALKLNRLSDAEMQIVLRNELPTIEGSELSALIAASNGSPGTALRLAGLDIAGLDAALAQLAQKGDADNRIRAELSQKLAQKQAQARYEAFLERVPAFIAQEAKLRSGRALSVAIRSWEDARQLSETAVRLSLDPQMTVFALGGIVAGLAHTGADGKA